MCCILLHVSFYSLTDPSEKKCKRLQIPIHMSRDLLMTAIQYFDYSLTFKESSKLFVEQKEITYCYSKYPQFYCNVLSSHQITKQDNHNVYWCSNFVSLRYLRKVILSWALLRSVQFLIINDNNDWRLDSRTRIRDIVWS